MDRYISCRVWVCLFCPHSFYQLDTIFIVAYCEGIELSHSGYNTGQVNFYRVGKCVWHCGGNAMPKYLFMCINSVCLVL